VSAAVVLVTAVVAEPFFGLGRIEGIGRADVGEVTGEPSRVRSYGAVCRGAGGSTCRPDRPRKSAGSRRGGCMP
jgi:hypothetical protein